MKYRIVESKPEFDKGVLEAYWEHVQAILEVIEARKKLGMKTEKCLEYEILRGVAYDTAEGGLDYWIKFLVPENEYFERRVYGFEVYKTVDGACVETRGARMCKAFLLPNGNKEYLSYTVQKMLDTWLEPVSGYVEPVRMKKLTEEILPPLIEWMGGKSESLAGGVAIKVRLAENERLREYGQDDVCHLMWEIENHLNQLGVPSANATYEEFWQQYFCLRKTLYDDALLKKMNVRIVLSFNGDNVRVSGVGSATDGGFVEATSDGLNQLQNFVQEIKEAAEGL